MLGHSQQYGGLAAFGSRTQLRQFGSDTYIGNVFQQNGRSGIRSIGSCGLDTAVLQFDNSLCQLLHPVGGDDTAHDVFVSVFIKHSAVGVQIHFTRNVHHFGKGYAVVPHPFRVELNLILFDVTAQYGNLRHAAGRKKARTDSPVGYGAQVEHGSRVGGKSYNQHLA